MDLKDTPFDERMQLASNPETDCLVLERLGCDVEVAVRAAVAANPSTPVDTLIALADELSMEVIHGLLHRDDELDIILDRLVKVNEVEALSLLAAHVHSPNVQLLVARHDEEDVVHALLHNANLTVETVEHLYGRCAERGVSAKTALQILSHLAAHSSTPEELLRQLATFPIESVRATVAANPATPLDVLEVLADDASALVRFVAWGNPFTPHYAPAFKKYGVDITRARLIRGGAAEYWGDLTYFMEDIPDEYWEKD